MEAAQQWLADHDEQVQQLTQSMHVLDDQLSSLDDVISARETLADLFPNMVLGYNSEGEAILANSQALEQQIDLMNERARLTRQQLLQDDDGEALKEYYDALEKLDELRAADDYIQSGGERTPMGAVGEGIDYHRMRLDQELYVLDAEQDALKMLTITLEDAIDG